ncbi:IDEAL domain-containing protein [Sporosarcina sp. ANT_H38]|uniref:IDEAL domain-containing protein n=1 Tax=Sporosarcina sp. ANT_H38 TaxID=2597358 RepID=UPI0011F28421|nr:IDEAL domain-containing protein [Sporosarcina sp. ANT_H38]KAA0944095.1 IDEAL domain-containing protein [Sporosarcina sp. ANT_H38]
MNNDHEREKLKRLMEGISFAVYANAFAEMGKINSQIFTTEMSDESKMSRQYLEHHPSIKTDVTDKDMLLLQIDMALDAGDMDMFKKLTDELKGMEVLI